MRQETQEDVILIENVPKQFKNKEAFDNLKESVGNAKDAIVGQFGVSMVLQFFLSGALSLLWNIFNTL